MLSDLALAEEVVDDGVLMVSELIANAVRHARAPYELRMYRTDRTVICEVVDGLRLLPQIPDGKAEALSLQDIDSIDDLTRLECGRGLEVVYQLSKGHCGARFTKTCATRTPVDGKAVWFAIDLRGRE
jgi:anti-sigma regulatory factor (Ser/Thr protein kinase)